LSESQETGSKIPTLLGAGIISLVVGVTSGFLVNWLNEKSLLLTYDITATQSFQGQNERIGIAAIRISNGGKAELEKIEGIITFTDATVKEVLLDGAPPDASTERKTNTRIDVHIPSLNPGEQPSLHVLVSLNGRELSTPSISLRAKGTTGRPEDKTKNSASFLDQTAPMLTTGAMVLVTLTAFFLRRTGNPLAGLRSISNDDNRDVFAFALTSNGLPDEANTIRNFPREPHIWALTDLVTQLLLATGVPEKMAKGVAALEAVLSSYSDIAEASQRILHLNATTLALAANDKPLAQSHFVLATTKKDSNITKRIKASKALSELPSPQGLEPK
jgi:hypothetical protein